MRKLYSLLVALLAVATSAWADLPAGATTAPLDGHIYYIVGNSPAQPYYLTTVGDTVFGQATLAPQNKAYQWYCITDGQTYQFVNMNNGRWLGNLNTAVTSRVEYTLNATDAFTTGCASLRDTGTQKYKLIKKDGRVSSGTKVIQNDNLSTDFCFLPLQTGEATEGGTFTVDKTTGSFTSTNTAGTLAAVWTSNTTPQFTINCGVNNMAWDGNNIKAYGGQSGSSTYTISAGSAYVITAFSFDFIGCQAATENVTFGSTTLQSSNTETQHAELTGLTAMNASFGLSGGNNGIKITNFTVTIAPATSVAETEFSFDVFPYIHTSQIPYRIPAIGTAQDGSIVCVADYRFTRADIGGGRLDLHVRRSHDNGRTWDKIMMPEVMTGDGNTAVGHQKCGYGDPCIVGDRESPRMMITSCSGTPGFFAGNRNHHQGWARWYSDDNGLTWSEPTYLDEDFVYSKFDQSKYGQIQGWFIGSGKICQSQTTKVGQYYRLYCVGSSNKSGVGTANWVMYSDDFGETWDFLGGCDQSPIPGGDEPKAEELPDGSILLSSRTTGGRNFNIFHFTDTRTAQGSWDGVCFSGSGNNGVIAQGNACNGEVMLIPCVRNSDQKEMFILLQSVPFGSGRSNVGIYYKELTSLADFATPQAIAANWTGRHQASFVASAYSTMTWQQDNTVGFLFEEDTYCSGGGGYNILYKNFSLEQLTGGAYTYKADVSRDQFTAAGVGARVDDLLSDSHFGTFVGQYTDDARAAITSAYDTYQANPTKAAYETFNAALTQLPCVEIQPGQAYRLRNYGRGNQDYYLKATTEKLTVDRAAENDNQKFIFEAQADGSWAIKNKATGAYIDHTLANETRTPMSATPSPYAVKSLPEGLSSLKSLAGSGPNYFLHLSADVDRIVPWQANSPAANNASFWYIEPTDVADAITAAPAAEAVSPIYDLQGRQLNAAPRHGLYIQRGRKLAK